MSKILNFKNFESDLLDTVFILENSSEINNNPILTELISEAIYDDLFEGKFKDKIRKVIDQNFEDDELGSLDVKQRNRIHRTVGKIRNKQNRAAKEFAKDLWAKATKKSNDFAEKIQKDNEEINKKHNERLDAMNRKKQSDKAFRSKIFKVGGAALGLSAVGLGIYKIVKAKREKKLKEYEEKYRTEKNPKIKAELKEKIQKQKDKLRMQ